MVRVHLPDSPDSENLSDQPLLALVLPGLFSVKAAVLTLSATWLLAFNNPAAVAPSLTRSHGNDLEYNLDLDEALNCFQNAIDTEPQTPASFRAVAGTYLLKIAFSRGTVTMDDFLGDDVAADMIHVSPPPLELASPFRRQAERALALADQQVEAHPSDADAHYQVGTTIGLLASYAATVDGQILGAMKLARRAYQESSTALTLDPGRKDAGLLVGTYQYLVSTRSLPVRWLAHLVGLGSDKARGIEMIEAAAHYPGENQTDARVMLALVYNRERRFDEALNVFAGLRALYPRNRLLWLESGATALRAGHLNEAEDFLNAGFAQLAVDGRPRAFGEDALWHYKRGLVRVRLNRVVDATADFGTALTGEARDWVRGRTHLELGRLADAAGDRARALGEYRAAVWLAKGDDDAIGLAEAERLLNGPSH